MTHKVYHQCIICGAGFLQIAKTISRHLQLHGVPMEEYYYTVRVRICLTKENLKIIKIVWSFKYVAEEQPNSRGQGSNSGDLHKTLPSISSATVKKPPQKVSKNLRLSKCLSKSPYLASWIKIIIQDLIFIIVFTYADLLLEPVQRNMWDV